MASDLVERLRKLSTLIGNAWNSKATIIAAADEIDALSLRSEAAEAALAEQSRLNEEMKAEAYRLVEALKPFATYMTPGMDCDDKGVPLPDDHGVGWIYLTHGDLRRAAAAIRARPADKEGA